MDIIYCMLKLKIARSMTRILAAPLVDILFN